MIVSLVLPLLVALAPPVQTRIDAALYVSARAWGRNPVLLKGLARVESTMQVNPPRYGPNGKPWGSPPHGRPWRYCGLLQTRGYPGKVAFYKVHFPPCSLLVLSPELSAWYGAMHLDGWAKRCGEALRFEGYHGGNAGCRGKTNGSFTRKVRKYARRR